MLAKGRTGFRIEAFKFLTYLSIPIVASQLFNYPEITQRIVDHYKFIEYPPEDEDTTQMKKDLEEMQNKLAQAKMRKIMMQRQLESLDQTATKANPTNDSKESVDSNTTGRWWNIGYWYTPKTSTNVKEKETK
mmetsp:Transcript_6143/g.8965  ORF Transcript_6143/g.8965 Transcript_6143/m.8965 type:complete len:133 (+) Transcript_6143:236-634(+)